MPQPTSRFIVIVAVLIGLLVVIHTVRQLNIIAGNIPVPQSKETAQYNLTMAKYKQIQSGMSYSEVSKIIGTPGEELSSSSIANIYTVMYSWINPDGSNMNALFQNGSLASKAQYGLR